MEASGCQRASRVKPGPSPIKPRVLKKLVLNHTSNENSKFSYRFVHHGQNKWMSQIDSATRLVVSETRRGPGTASYLRSGLHNPDPKKFWTILPSRFLYYHFTWIDKAKIGLFSVLRIAFSFSLSWQPQGKSPDMQAMQNDTKDAALNAVHEKPITPQVQQINSSWTHLVAGA